MTSDVFCVWLTICIYWKGCNSTKYIEVQWRSALQTGQKVQSLKFYQWSVNAIVLSFGNRLIRMKHTFRSNYRCFILCTALYVESYYWMVLSSKKNHWKYFEQKTFMKNILEIDFTVYFYLYWLYQFIISDLETDTFPRQRLGAILSLIVLIEQAVL